MNPALNALYPYPFERLRTLLDGSQGPSSLSPIALSVGEPQHPAPDCVKDALSNALSGLSRYPATKGDLALRQSIADWLCQRFNLSAIDPNAHVLPVNGTREALFAVAQALVARDSGQLVMMPNPCYQIYEGAALLAGAKPSYLPCTAANGYQPDFSAIDDDSWRACQMLYICTPGNPAGAVMSLETLQDLIRKARDFDFIIVSDECYSEIYPDETLPPPGLLQAAAAIGLHDYDRCLAFHSLSKRSNLPGLRSGFVAGDAQLLAAFLKYRTYHGCAMPPHHQAASIAAWSDETHVIENRRRYREKFTAVLTALDDTLAVSAPEAGFYLWPRTPIDDAEFARRLFIEQGVTVLPGQFLGRDDGAGNPAQGHVRLALVAEHADCVEAAHRIATFTRTL